MGYYDEEGSLIETRSEDYEVLAVSGRGGEVESRNRYSRFLVLISNHIKDPEESLRMYRVKEIAESAFNDLKNGMDVDCLRIHGEVVMEGKAFLVLILKIEVFNVILADLSFRHMFRTEINEEISLFRRSEIEKNTAYTE